MEHRTLVRGTELFFSVTQRFLGLIPSGVRPFCDPSGDLEQRNLAFPPTLSNNGGLNFRRRDPEQSTTASSPVDPLSSLPRAGTRRDAGHVNTQSGRRAAQWIESIGELEQNLESLNAYKSVNTKL